MTWAKSQHFLPTFPRGIKCLCGCFFYGLLRTSTFCLFPTLSRHFKCFGWSFCVDWLWLHVKPWKWCDFVQCIHLKFVCFAPVRQCAPHSCLSAVFVCFTPFFAVFELMCVTLLFKHCLGTKMLLPYIVISKLCGFVVRIVFLQAVVKSFESPHFWHIS